MPMLLHYDGETGTILAVHTANTLELLDAQQGSLVHPEAASLLLPIDDPVSILPPAEVQERWYVVQGDVQPRATLLLTGTPTPFAANETDVCTVSVTPFVPCTVLVNDTPYGLTEADPLLEITASVPAFFVLRLLPLAGYWAEPSVVEAV